MPSVADELAALRAKGSVKSRASNLKDGAALSTPEAEAAAIRTERENTKLGDKKAKEIVNKGSHGAAQASHEQDKKFTDMKKEGAAKKAAADANMKKGGSAGGYSKEMEHGLGQTGKKKADRKNKEEARKIMNKGASERFIKSEKNAAPVAAPQAPKEKMAVKKDTLQKASTKEEPSKKESTPAPVTINEPAPVEKTEDAPELEEIYDHVPELEEFNNAMQQQQPSQSELEEAEASRQITNRNEKKARKMMTRLNMRPVPNIARVTLKVGGNRGYFFMDRPDVFCSPGGKTDTYVIFGEARQGGQGAGGAQARAQAAQQQAAMAAAQGGKGVMPSVVEGEDEEDVPELAAAEGAGDSAGGDDDGVEAKDIDLVMSQASCSRAKAVVALKENDGDLVNAIMSLTT